MNDGDIAFMMAATTFVMLQTPALGLAQAGIIRRKNALSMLMQVFSGITLGSLLWMVCGFSLVFGTSYGGFIGSLEYAFFNGVSVTCCFERSSADSIPAILLAAFQMVFALMVPVIVTGAWAERMEFTATMIFMFVWPFLVYYPVAHWIWNADGWLATWGVLDFAGGMVIHSTTGMAALAVSSILQNRIKSEAEIGYHNLPMFATGGAFIWAGWYSFNGGSAYKANGQASQAMMATHLGGCMGATVWIIMEKAINNRWKLTELLNGAFAGLASVTAGSGFVSSRSALCIGLLGGLSANLYIRYVKPRLKLDDALDVMALQGVPGLVGSVCVGLFAEYSPTGPLVETGLFIGGSPTLLWRQIGACCVIASFAFVVTLAIIVIMRLTIGLEVSLEAEEKGLDLYQVGEQAYDDQLDSNLDLGKSAMVSKLIDAAREGNLHLMKKYVKSGMSPDGADYDKRTAMHLAASEGHLAVVKYLVSEHCDINALDRYNCTPLVDALRHNRLEVVEWLKTHGAIVPEGYGKDRDILLAASENNIAEVTFRLERGMDTVDSSDYDKRTALHISASEGHGELCKVLIQRGADITAKDRWGNTPLQCAIADKRRSTAVLLFQLAKKRAIIQSASLDGDRASEATPLLSGAARPVGPSADDALLQMGLIDVEEEFQKHDHRVKEALTIEARALITAAVNGDLAECTSLLQKGAPVDVGDYDNRTPLHLAACANSLPVVELLVSYDCNVDAFDRFGRTALQDALAGGFAEVAAVLRAAGATMTNPETARRLCWAAYKDSINDLELLLAGGAHLGCADYDGRTALHVAASEGHTRIVDWLLLNGVSTTSRDRFGGLPIDDAKREGHTAILTILERHERAPKAVQKPHLAKTGSSSWGTTFRKIGGRKQPKKKTVDKALTAPHVGAAESRDVSPRGSVASRASSGSGEGKGASGTPKSA